MSYEPGKGYRDGWEDRHFGKPNMAPMGWGNATTDDSVYWDEYKQGYADASKRIVEDARRTISDMKADLNKRFLTESNERLL